jgi:RNA ligase partner protein
VKKTPNRYEVKIPAAIFYEYIISVRQKINRGRRLAEDFILEASAIGKASEKLEEDTANLISKFRDKYRTVMRQGLLDSAPDLDVLLLAKELEAGVVSSDIGIKKWSEKLGLRFVEASKFPRMLKEYLVLLGVKEPESSQKIYIKKARNFSSGLNLEFTFPKFKKEVLATKSNYSRKKIF